MVSLKTSLESAKYCKELVSSPGFAGLKAKVEAEVLETGKRLALMQIKPEAMQVVAERVKARFDLIQEILGEANRFEKAEEKYETYLKSHNS